MSDAPRPSAPAAPGLAPVDLDPAAASSVDVRGLQAKVRHLQDRYAEVQRAEQETRAKVLQVRGWGGWGWDNCRGAAGRVMSGAVGVWNRDESGGGYLTMSMAFFWYSYQTCMSITMFVLC